MKKKTFPKSTFYNQSDLEIISLVLGNASKEISEIETYTAPWLLSNFDDHIWHTKNRGRELMVDGKWRSTIVVNWNFELPNGSRFTDAEFHTLLTLAKKIIFRLRNGGVSGSFGVISWGVVIDDLRNLICWMVLHNKRLRPDLYVFSKITKRDLDSLLYSIATGGWFNALRYPWRALESISNVMQVPLPNKIGEESVMDLPEEFVNQIIPWFEDNGYYKSVYSGTYFGKKFLNRGMIAKLIGVDPSTIIGSSKFLSFLRQFEPDFWFTDILVSVIQRHEYPDQNSFSREKYIALTGNRKDLETTAESLFKIFRMASAINSEITPRYLAEIPKGLYLKHSGICEESGLTKFVPIHIGLTYFNEAIKWIECYGEAIIDCYVDMASNIDSTEYIRLEASQKRHIRMHSFSALDFKKYKFKHLKNTGLRNFIDLSSYSRSSVEFGFNEMRTKPSLEEATRILIGACVVCISICKPSRNDEIVHLWRDCLVIKDDGYYIRFDLGKSNYDEHYHSVEKPIPVITAKAIRLLQRLGEAVEEVSAPNKKAINKGRLFNLPSYSLARPRLISSNILCGYLDVFCDYVNLPPIDGVRWYIRIHEMRKWFLLLLFWGSRSDVLDACRWIAGHTDANHIYNYIQHEFAGEELTKLEAKYAMDRLLNVEINNNAEDSDLIKIYQRILSHFRVEAISLIPESEWCDYVSEMHQRCEFTLEHQFIYESGSDVLSSVSVSFVLRKSV